MALRRALLLPFLPLLFASCATAPKQTEALRRIHANPPAIVEGRVQDEDGRPVAGIGVRGIPRARDIPWLPAATTQCNGTFRLALAAPGAYGFLLQWRGLTVITASPQDPARLEIPVDSGEHRGGIDLVFLAPLWQQVTEAAPRETPSCP